MKQLLPVVFSVLLCTRMLKLCMGVHFTSHQSPKSDSIENMCRSVLPEGYKFFESPHEDIPVNIYNRFEILDIGEINEEKMDYLLHMFVTTTWTDPRISLKGTEGRSLSTILPKECLNYIWQPDIFYETAKSVEIFRSSAPSILVKVFNGGLVSMTIRYMFRASCHMHFANYPFDSQQCEFFVSLISPDSEAFLYWSSEDKLHGDLHPVINIVRSIEPLQFSLGKVKADKLVDEMPDGNYTTLVANFTFHRRLTGSLINTFIPSTLIVTMSWFGFWLGVDSAPARVALSVTSLLTLCTQVEQYQSQLPPVNYIKAMDIWLFVCIFLVFSTLLEYAIAYNIHYRKKKTHEKSVSVEPQRMFRLGNAPRVHNSNSRLFRRRSSSSTEEDSMSLLTLKTNILASLKEIWTKLQRKTIDEISRKLYPGFFIIFVSFYWAYYLGIYYHVG